jgi:hypothetical protein
MDKRRLFHFIAMLALLIPTPLRAQTDFIGRTEIRQLEWGGVGKGWHHLFSLSEAKIKSGPLGSLEAVLDDNSPRVDAWTELLLHFDGGERDRISFDSDGYRAMRVDVLPSKEIKKFGAGAAGFLNSRHLIEIMPLENSLFFEKGALKSFTIDFYLYPSLITDATAVFTWHAPVVSKGGDFTGIRAFYEGGKLTWRFEKVFQRKSGEAMDIEVGENTTTPLNEWRHHALSYDSGSGLLAVFFDGRESNLAWATEGGKQRGTLLLGRISPYLKVPMRIGESYLGYIDEFRVTRAAKSRFYLGNYRDSGEVRSEVLDLVRELDRTGAEVVKVSWDSEEENGTAVRVYYRVSDTYFEPSAEMNENLMRVREQKGGGELHGYPEWVPVKNGEVLGLQPSGGPGATRSTGDKDRGGSSATGRHTGSADGPLPAGRYLQWKAELFGTGESSPFLHGSGSLYSPALRSLIIYLESDDPPLPPAILKAAPIDGGFELSWLANRESDLRGYRVYYGSAARYYHGKGADLGDSPAGVGNVNKVVLKGLANEQVYFVAVTALDAAGQESGFSRELVVRPSRVFGAPADGR